MKPFQAPYQPAPTTTGAGGTCFCGSDFSRSHKKICKTQRAPITTGSGSNVTPNLSRTPCITCCASAHSC